jgi:hypothetical protein
VSGFALPGLKKAQERVDEAEAKLEALETELDEARDEFRSIDRYRRILWQEGKYGLDLPVRDVLSQLGMASFSRPDDPAVFSFNGRYVYVETEGSVGAVGLAPHYRLRQRLEREIEAKGEAPRGIIVVNGFRETPPESRGQQYDGSLKAAAETMSYCIIEATKLFGALEVRMAADVGAVRTFVEGLVETNGVYQGPLPVGVESQEDEEDDE